MSGLPCPHCGDMVDVFGSGGGQRVADGLSAATGTKVPLLGKIPIDTRLREGGDTGKPVVVDAPDSPAAVTLREIADRLGGRERGLSGLQLGLTPLRNF